jgi:hypothetical protein
MDNSLTPDEKRRFGAWRYSPSVFSTSTDELIVAYKLGKLLRYPPSRVLKALRGLQGLDAAMSQAVDETVAQDSSLTFTGEPPTRLVVFIDTSNT